MRRWAFAVIALVACTRRNEPPRGLEPIPTASVVSAMSDASPSARVSTTDAIDAQAPSKCSPPPPGSTSDDLAPAIRGTTGDVALLPWMESRGVPRDAALTWILATFGNGAPKEYAETVGRMRCGVVHVGEPREEAVVCENTVVRLILEVHAVIVTVRAKRPSVALDVGLRMVSLDFPDARSLDLALAIAADGMSVEVSDRAPDGTVLVEAESHCRAGERRVAECAAKLAAHPNPESLVRKVGRGEVIDMLDGCPLHRGKDGRLEVASSAMLSATVGIYPATLHDCAGGRALLIEMEKQAPPENRKPARQALAFFDRSCANRGRWLWQNGRFVKPG